VDIGVHQDGRVHISELSDKFAKKPSDIVRLNQKASVTVLTVDAIRNRISLSMKRDAAPPGQPEPDAQ
ncbi:MAG: S1 RNA-binding domain-containing protein, partial [Dehalococcoidales bacterium]|nr:S1 RNA-binding domain-containing protein [Dehalococcoidales bacterium]